MLKIKELLSILNDLLKSHDWTFEWSDDHSVFLRGHAEKERIESLCKVIGETHAEEVSNLWNAFCPVGWERSIESFKPKATMPKWRLREGIKPNRNFRFKEINAIRRELGDENLKTAESRKEAVFRLTWGTEPTELERDIGFIFHMPSHPELAELA